MLKTIYHKLTAAFNFIFGKISWNSPPWLKSLFTNATIQPKKFWSILITFVGLLVATGFTYHWYKNLPQPPQVLAQMQEPAISAVEKDQPLVPQPLTFKFGITSNEEFYEPVAPLNDIGKEVKAGVTLTPHIEGKWQWQSDHELTFTPKADWPAEQNFKVAFTKNLFTNNVNIAQLNYSFTTQPFKATIDNFKFYQDPENPQLRQAVATISFNFPVDPKSLENSLSFTWQASKNQPQEKNQPPIQYTITYDEHKRTAYIHTETLALPQEDRYLELNLVKGLQPLNSPARAHEAVQATVLIPSAARFFQISNATTAIVRNQKNQPEQILTVETSLGVTAATLKKALHVYVLPQDYPATAATEAKENYQWQNPGEVTPAILALAQPLNLTAIPGDRDQATLHAYQYNVSKPGYLYIKIDKGVRAFNEFSLATDYTAILKIADYPQEISFLHEGSLLALGSEEKLSVLVRGIPAVKFTIARVLPDAVNHLVSQTSGHFNNPTFVNYGFNQDNISEIFSEVKSFDNSEASKQQYTALDLSKYLATKTNTHGSLGLFLLKAESWKPDNASQNADEDENSSTVDEETDEDENSPAVDEATDEDNTSSEEDSAPIESNSEDASTKQQINRLILITDLGLIVKDNADNTHDIFVQSISQGKPVNNAAVSILGKNGLPLFTRNTDTQGHVNFPALTDFKNEREPTVYVVHNGNDVSFMPYNREDRKLNYSRFDIGGIENSTQNQTALTAYIFSDRGIYRPGDTAHIGMIIKQPFALPQPAGLPLQATITDPKGATVKEVKLSLNDNGYLSLDFQTNASSATGTYKFSLFTTKDDHDNNLIGSAEFQVAEFLPDRLRITTHLSQEQTKGWISPSNLKAKVNLWNLYGAPAANHKISGNILLTPQAISFKEFPNYTFVDPLLKPEAPAQVFTESLEDTQTNEQGEAELSLQLDRFEKGTYQLSVYTEGFEAEGGRSVTTKNTALVSPLNYLVGYAADGDLNFIKQNSSRKINLIAVNPQLKQQSLSNLKIEFFKLVPVTTLVKKDDGTLQYQSVIQTNKISSKALTITEQGIDYPLLTDKIGDYLVTILDEKNTELTKFKYSVVGQSQQPLAKNAELTVKLNKTEFSPEEEIELQITAPYIGAGLITIERDKVYTSQWFKTSTTSSVQKIRIPKDFQGDGYINVAFVRDLNSPEIFMSPLSYSVIPFSVTHKDRDIKINLTTPALVRPGQPLNITYKTDKPSKIIVFAVDEGILQVARYKTPNPLAFFFQKHALTVNTSQIVDQILPKFIAARELSTVGGDGGEGELNKNLNPFKRRTDAPVVYWSGIINADSTPQQLTYQVPDYYNGTMRIMAVAVASDAVGSAEQQTYVRGDFVINPNVPTFVAPGDEFDVTVGVANNVEKSGENAEISVAITASAQLEIIGSDTQKMIIPEGQERSAHFKIRAKTLLGSAELNFTARLNDKSSKIASTLSVRPAIAYATAITSGYSTEKSKSLSLDRKLYPEYRKVEAIISPSPLILVAGLQQYLNDYPYGCVEQLTSKAFAWLALVKQPELSAENTQTLNDKIQLTLQMLAQRQMTNGGFSYWPEVGSTEENNFASVYAMHFLTTAREQGYAVPKDVFSAGIIYLQDLVSQDNIASLEDARLHAYAIYLLTRNEIVTTNYLTHLQLTLEKNPEYNWQSDITNAYIAATYQLLQNTAEAGKIINYYKPKTVADSVNTDFYNHTIADAQYLYLLNKHFPERLQKLDPTLVTSLASALSNDTISTLISGYSSLALATYNQFYSSSADDSLTITEVLADGKQNNIPNSHSLYQKATLNSDVTNITFNNLTKRGYFYQLTQAGFDTTLPKEAIKQGIEVYREFRTVDNKSLTNTSLGDEITVHIRARAIDNQAHSNIALLDLLPGGFEVVRDSIELDKMTNIDYVDIREDRVIFFGRLTSDSQEITYRIKATNIGKYTVPPLYATAMYNPLIKSLGVAGSITVEK